MIRVIASAPLAAQQTRSRPPFLLRQEAAGGDVKPQYESLQLGLFCCLPRLISFNYLSPFCFLFFFSPSQILGFFHVIIFFLSPQLRLALPVCNYRPFSRSFHLSPFVLHQIIPSRRSPGSSHKLPACLPGPTSPLCQGLPVLLLLLLRGPDRIPPTLFVSQGLMHYSALRMLQVLER